MNNFECNNDSSTSKKCDKFGTFSAADANSINTSTPADGSIIPFSSGNTQSIINEIIDVKTASLIGFSTAINDGVIIDNTKNLARFFIQPSQFHVKGLLQLFQRHLHYLEGKFLSMV
ncbi:hypothetical protein [Bacillus sp. RS11]|uniref:hypothetical protein n=1 Tax=Lysinibacillus sp. RS11 TaxID=3242682 RepID=UPI0035C68680